MSKWEMVRLGDEIKVTSGGTPSRAINEYWIGGAGDTLVPWVKTGDLKSMYLSEVDESITTTGLQNCSAKMFPKDTLLVAMY
ncbi:MAG: restriction endonuclease subunit S, partial [Peptococcaceae bacterium]|nr:restriction endonuclease subunit S [Peptococcaceae bacterium]